MVLEIVSYLMALIQKIQSYYTKMNTSIITYYFSPTGQVSVELNAVITIIYTVNYELLHGFDSENAQLLYEDEYFHSLLYTTYIQSSRSI
jgi:hypothetical protein